MLVFVYVKPNISASDINGLIVDSLSRHKSYLEAAYIHRCTELTIYIKAAVCLVYGRTCGNHIEKKV
jgi:hypothetical protein